MMTLDNRRVRSAGPVKSLAELDARRAFRGRLLVEFKARAKQLIARQKTARIWVYKSNEFLDGFSPATAIAKDYLSEHVMNALLQVADRCAPSNLR